MKKYLLVVLLVTALSSPVLDGQEKYIQSPVTHVTVFRQGAQLSGDAVISVQPGTWDFVAGGLSPYIDPNSIQVRGEGDFMITGVAYRTNYLENPAESDAISTLRGKIKHLELKLEDEGTALEVLLERERFLKAELRRCGKQEHHHPRTVQGSDGALRNKHGDGQECHSHEEQGHQESERGKG